MPIRAWFPTYIYCEPLQARGLDRLNDELASEIASLRDYDDAGRRWSEANYPGGYTSYASMNTLHTFSSTFWVNVMPPTAAHSLHLHPLAFVSGTYYVRTPKGCPGLKFEDPRLDRFMAAPPKLAGARRENRSHVTYPAEAGNVILFESWLRHEVAANRVDDERISISFNYNWS
jgi:hypothetical protein